MLRQPVFDWLWLVICNVNLVTADSLQPGTFISVMATNFILGKRQPPSRTHLKKNLYRLLAARSDFFAAHTAAKLMVDRVQHMRDPLFSPLFSATVVCYARPFTNNDPLGALPKRWSEFDEPRRRELHEMLMRARHDIVAHSNLDVRRARIVPPGAALGFVHHGKRNSPYDVGTEISTETFPIAAFPHISSHAQGLSAECNSEIDVLVETLYEGMDLPHAKFDIRFDEGL